MQSQYAYRRNDSHLLNRLALIIIFYLVGNELCLKLIAANHTFSITRFVLSRPSQHTHWGKRVEATDNRCSAWLKKFRNDNIAKATHVPIK